MITIKNGKPVAWLAIFADPVPVIELHEDEMQCVIECPYCHERTTIGETIMNSGFIGCPNCFFVPGGLRETVEWYRENDYEKYNNGNFYERGYIENRDNRVLKKSECQNDE